MGAFLFAVLCAVNVHAADLIWDVGQGRTLTVEEFALTRKGGSILVFGEQHATPDNKTDPENIRHHANQVSLLRAITESALSTGLHLTVGMEFLTYPTQDFTDQYMSGALDEATFLKKVNWKAAPFEFYREQIQMPRLSGGRTLALNIPKAISRQVAKGGPERLTAEQRAWAPPLWELGNEKYFERFQEVMGGGHISADKMERYFWAQSLWDDTMAWNIVKQWNLDPLAVQVIIVGEFHAEFGHGLPARILAQGAASAQTMLQVVAADLSEEEIARVTAPDPRYGNRADYFWISAP